MDNFIQERLIEENETDFYTPIKKMKLQTFTNMKKVVKVSVKDRLMPMKSHSNLFGQLALIIQTQNINLRDVFKYPLGPYPWPLCGVMGELRKSNKASLLHKLEKGIQPLEYIVGQHVTIIDGMALVQKSQSKWQNLWKSCRGAAKNYHHYWQKFKTD